MRRSFLVLLMALAAILGSPAPASAEDDRAVVLFQKSVEAYRAGRFGEAVELLREAYRLQPNPVLLYDLARAYESLGDFANASKAYRQYLDAQPNAPDRSGIERRVARLEAEIAERDRLLREREAARRREVLAEQNARRPNAIPWIVAGVGGAALVAGGVLGVVALQRHGDALDGAQADVAGRQRDANTFAGAANIAFVAGGVLVAVGVAWGLLDLRATRRARTTAFDFAFRVF
jgi:tetratricopeptide (TPR) repeat protein